MPPASTLDLPLIVMSKWVSIVWVEIHLIFLLISGIAFPLSALFNIVGISFYIYKRVCVANFDIEVIEGMANGGALPDQEEGNGFVSKPRPPYNRANWHYIFFSLSL